jgi:predicted MFS family arabinose efflux permease
MLMNGIDPPTPADIGGRPKCVVEVTRLGRDARGSGAILGLNVAMSSLGWLGAAAVGGWLVGRHGFGSLGVLTAGVAARGALFAVIASRARRR